HRLPSRARPLQSSRPQPTDAELRRADRLRPLLRGARAVRRHRSGRNAVVISMLRTPLGAMLAGATDDGIWLLELRDRPMLPPQLEVLARRLRRPLVTGGHALLDRLQAELDDYF